MTLGLGLGLHTSGARQALAEARYVETLTNSAGQTVTFSNGQPVRLARPVGATLLRNSRGQVVTNSSGAAIYTV